MSFTQELKELAHASELMDAGGCWREVLHLHRELGRSENALGRADWTMLYGERGDWRVVLRAAAAETLREARRAASVYDIVRLKEAAGCYSRLAGCRYADVGALMLKPGERGGASRSGEHGPRGVEFVASEVRWTVERPNGNGRRRRGEGRSRRRRRQLSALGQSRAEEHGSVIETRARNNKSPHGDCAGPRAKTVAIVLLFASQLSSRRRPV
jgi:hypothetical protein